MRLNEQGLREERHLWEAAGYKLPQYDHGAMVRRTRSAPFWVHFGAGNLFRAFQANVIQELLDKKVLDKGVVAVGDRETMEALSHPHDDHSVHVTLKADGTIEKTIIGSVAEYLTIDDGCGEGFERLKEIFCGDALQMATFTITEKGYSLSGSDGSFTAKVAEDLQAGPDRPKSYMGKIAALLYARYQSGRKPVAMVSMDNCSHNGTRLYEAVSAFAIEWSGNGRTEPGFADYIANPEHVSFPWTMIDKITPRPDASVEALLEKDGIEDLKPIITSRNTYIAPFVNTEECQYLVIEDAFPAGRPPLEQAGLIFTDRETVDKVEKMKVCTCLNPLHTALAVFGCLLGFDTISDEMKNDTLKKLVEGIGYDEGLPVVTDPGVLDPRKFLDDVLKIRFPNPFMPDTPQRIATDTSQKLAVRFGETIRAYQSSPDLDVKDLKKIPLVFAGWLRYLRGTDDEGRPFQISPDPLADVLCPYVESGDIRPILENEQIFGVDLCKIGLADTVEGYFEEMLTGCGAVRRTLEKYV